MAKGKKNNIGMIIVIILIVLLAVVGIGALVLNKIVGTKPLEKPGEELGYDIFIGDENMPVKTSAEEGRDLLKELSQVNVTYKDAKAWLKVPGTTIDYPIFQGNDNTQYYRDDRDAKAQDWGETFLDYRNDVSKLADNMTNTIIYGHNTETDNRFTPLLNYKREEFYQTHKTIELATSKGLYTYEIFSVYSVDATKFYYIDTVFESQTEYENFLSSLVKKSRYGTDVEVSAADSILTLSTCDYSIKNGRFVVHAKLVKTP